MRLHAGIRSVINSPDEKPKITWQLLRRVLRHARPYRWLIGGVLLLILTHTGLSLLTPLILRDLLDRTIPAGDLGRLAILASALLLIPAANGAIQVGQRHLNSRVGEGVVYDLRMALYGHLQRMSLRFFTNTKVGELMSRLNNDVVGAQTAISSTIVNIATQIVQVAAVLVVMLTLEWRLTVIAVAILPLFILAVRLLGTRLRDIARKQMDATAQMNAMMNETLNIGGALLVKLFGRRRLEVDRFSQKAGQVRNLGVQRTFIGSFFIALILLLSAVGTALVYGLGGYFAIKGAFTIGTIVAFGAYLTNLYGALRQLANAPVEFATSMVSFERVFEVIDLPLDIPEKADAVVLKDTRGEIVFDRVSFRYATGSEPLLSDVHRYGSMDNVTAVLSGTGQKAGESRISPGRQSQNRLVEMARLWWAANQPEVAVPSPSHTLEVNEENGHHSQARSNALQEISFRAEPGRLVALVGPSGAGKTTLTYLIPRLYDPCEGTIRIDGTDLRDVTIESLSAQIGMVTQETYLFHDTIRTNLQYARLDASQNELEAACRVANIHDFIQALPDGYDTIVGQRGYRLSGGEKQRIALARVILKDPRILVLDEATSSLDSESEALIQDALAKVMAKRTSIVIAHRLSTILAADLILVIDRGKIVQTGTHAELLAQDGLYANLYHTQFGQDQGQGSSAPICKD
ncbi:MAG: ABC transporter ATP-binding protein [Bradymonadales bacterium]|nr:ABC transporter ATP-binding protein [Bradymonadales bacterium]